MSSPRVLIYLLRRDLRLRDNPIFHEISKNFQQSQPYTHLLPVYIFAAQQIEVSGFLSSENERSPFPEARSKVAGFWRCGPKRATFLAESVWELKQSLNSIGSGLEIRVGLAGPVIRDLLNAFKEKSVEVAVWLDFPNPIFLCPSRSGAPRQRLGVSVLPPKGQCSPRETQQDDRRARFRRAEGTK